MSGFVQLACKTLKGCVKLLSDASTDTPPSAPLQGFSQVYCSSQNRFSLSRLVTST